MRRRGTLPGMLPAVRADAAIRCHAWACCADMCARMRVRARAGGAGHAGVGQRHQEDARRGRQLHRLRRQPRLLPLHAGTALLRPPPARPVRLSLPRCVLGDHPRCRLAVGLGGPLAVPGLPAHAETEQAAPDVALLQCSSLGPVLPAGRSNDTGACHRRLPLEVGSVQHHMGWGCTKRCALLTPRRCVSPAFRRRSCWWIWAWTPTRSTRPSSWASACPWGRSGALPLPSAWWRLKSVHPAHIASRLNSCCRW